MEIIYIVMGLYDGKVYSVSAYSTKEEARVEARKLDEHDKENGFKVGKECHHFVDVAYYFR